MCRLAALMATGCGLAQPNVWRRWLPGWLPAISLASLMFEPSNIVSNPRQACSAQVRDSYHLS